jgi:phenylalanyl-tRNA synthetase alpha chain
MPTGTFVESGFWCFDALFVPQLHPARELQDTFYLSGMFLTPLPSSTYLNLVDPSTSLPPPSDYYERVARVHEHGGYGSIGYRTPWSHEESHKLLLRTHTTASSAAMLYKLAARCRGEDIDDDLSSKLQPEAANSSNDGFRPAKLFSIDRVFRNETMDATHLAEFHQVEGVVADRNLTLADLIGALWILPSSIFPLPSA